MIDQPLSLIVKTFLETVLLLAIVCMSGGQTANYLSFLDYRLSIIYPKIEVTIEVTVLPIDVSQNFVEVQEKNLNFFPINLDKVRLKKFGKLRFK